MALSTSRAWLDIPLNLRRLKNTVQFGEQVMAPPLKTGFGVYPTKRNAEDTHKSPMLQMSQG
jgi:hypothetical protein